MSKQNLYNTLINNISVSVKQSLNEMAKKIDHRTIDRKLWLSVASVCSHVSNNPDALQLVRPRSTYSKENLLDRYVAALLITKSPCPKTVRDIEKIKVFKLIAQKALELGATILDIQDLYNKNAGITTSSTSTTITKPVSTPKPPITPKPTAVTPSTPRVRKPLSERVLKLKTEDEIRTFLRKHSTGCTTNMAKMDKFLADADAVIQAYKLTYSNRFYSGFSINPFGWHDSEGIYFTPTGDSYELYGNSYYGERYNKATQPELIYHYEINGHGNNVLLRNQDKKTIKRLLSKLTPMILKFIWNIAEEAMKKRNTMIRNGEIKTRGVKFDLSEYGFNRTYSSYLSWAQQYAEKFLKRYNSIYIGYRTGTGKVRSFSYYKGKYYVDLYIQNDSTDIDTEDPLSNLLEPRNYTRRYGLDLYEYFEEGDRFDGDFVCTLYKDNIEEVCKIAYENAKAEYIKYKGK